MKPASGLILALDDWGLSPGVNQGILELIALGCVRSVSLMPNQPYLSHGLEELKASGVELTFHLNLTLGKPVSGQASVPSLSASDGHFFPLPALLWRSFRGKLNASELRLETQEQLAMLHRHGVRPRALESHHNIHLYEPLLWPLEDLLKKNGIDEIRIVGSPNNPVPFLAGRLFPFSAWRRRSTQCLSMRSLRCSRRLGKKFRSSPGKCFLLHPAKRDDLEEIGCRDSMRTRKAQLDSVLGYLSLAQPGLPE